MGWRQDQTSSPRKDHLSDFGKRRREGCINKKSSLKFAHTKYRVKCTGGKKHMLSVQMSYLFIGSTDNIFNFAC